MTDIVSKTNKPPAIAKTISCLTINAIDPNVAPNANDPVSPINTLAGDTVVVAEQAGTIFSDLKPVFQKAFGLVQEISTATSEQETRSHQRGGLAQFSTILYR